MTQAARTTVAAAAAAARLESVQTLHNPPALLGNLPEKGEECDQGGFPATGNHNKVYYIYSLRAVLVTTPSGDHLDTRTL